MFEDYDNVYYVNSLDLCFRYNLKRVALLFCTYFIGMYLCRKRITKRHQFVTNVISTLSSYHAIFNGSSDTLPDYYIYDTVMSALSGDMLMLAHHLFTMYCLAFCSSDLDYITINYYILLVKFGDAFVNHYKITDALDLYSKYPLGIRIYQLTTVIITMILWIPFRLVIPFWVYPFNCTSMNVLCSFLHMFSFYWMFKFWKLAKKIGNDMLKQVKLRPEDHLA